MKWRDIQKIDAHVHIIPDEIHAANPDADDEFSFAKSFLLSEDHGSVQYPESDHHAVQ